MANFYATYPGSGGGGGVPTYANFAAFPSAVTAGNGALAIDLSTDILYISNGAIWEVLADPAGSALAITALHGDVVATGPGDVAATIQPLAVTNSKIANATIDLTTKVTGALPITNGGTGQTTANPAFNALSPLTTKGDIVGFSTVNARVPVGSNTQVLTADSAQTLGVKWATPTTGTVTSVNVSGGTTGLTFSGGPITSSGTITMAGTLVVTDGGTGTATQFTAGSVVYAGASGIYAQNNANFFWDNSNTRLGVGTNVPATPLDVRGNQTALGLDVANAINNQWIRFTTGSGVNVYGDMIADTYCMCWRSEFNFAFIPAILTGGSGAGSVTFGFNPGVYSSPFLVGIQSQTTTQISAIIKSLLLQTADLQQWQNSSGSPLSLIDSSGDLTIRRDQTTNQMLISATAVSGYTGIWTGRTSATASTTNYAFLGNDNTTLFNSSTELDFRIGNVTVFAVFLNAGTPRSVFGYLPTSSSGDALAAVSIIPQNASFKGLVIEGNAAQAGNLQEWQDSTATVLTKIDPSGKINSAAFTASSLLATDASKNIVSTGFSTASLLAATQTVNVSSNVTLTDKAVHFVDTSSARSLTLPSPATTRYMIIKDSTGSAGTNNITLVRFGSEKIETVAASFLLDYNLGSWTIVSNGTDWFLI